MNSNNITLFLLGTHQGTGRCLGWRTRYQTESKFVLWLINPHRLINKPKVHVYFLFRSYKLSRVAITRNKSVFGGLQFSAEREKRCWNRSQREKLGRSSNTARSPSYDKEIDAQKTRQPKHWFYLQRRKNVYSTNFRYTEDRGHALTWHLLPIFVHTRKGNSILPIAHIPPWRVLIDIIH